MHAASSPVSSAQSAIQESPIENVKVDNTIGSLMDDPTCSSTLDVRIKQPITIKSESATVSIHVDEHKTIMLTHTYISA